MSYNLNSFMSISFIYIYKNLFENKFGVKTYVNKSGTPKLLIQMLRKETYCKYPALY